MQTCRHSAVHTQGNIVWLEEHEILPTLLRANLHTRQYADLVGRVLKRLAPHERGIADTDLTFLWNLTQKVVQYMPGLSTSDHCELLRPHKW